MQASRRTSFANKWIDKGTAALPTLGRRIEAEVAGSPPRLRCGGGASELLPLGRATKKAHRDVPAKEVPRQARDVVCPEKYVSRPPLDGERPPSGETGSVSDPLQT